MLGPLEQSINYEVDEVDEVDENAHLDYEEKSQRITFAILSTSMRD